MQKKLTGYMILLFVILFGFILPSCRAQQEQSITALSPKEASTLIEKHKGNSDFVILDIERRESIKVGTLKMPP